MGFLIPSYSLCCDSNGIQFFPPPAPLNWQLVGHKTNTTRKQANKKTQHNNEKGRKVRHSMRSMCSICSSIILIVITKFRLDICQSFSPRILAVVQSRCTLNRSMPPHYSHSIIYTCLILRMVCVVLLFHGDIQPLVRLFLTPQRMWHRVKPPCSSLCAVHVLLACIRSCCHGVSGSIAAGCARRLRLWLRQMRHVRVGHRLPMQASEMNIKPANTPTIRATCSRGR